ncbi:aldo/keto reductase [Halobacteriovorax sp. JY17]|uniref:aldo/keto reductase n=1 Tax=Halobacteriovorax sp. JY17 TaxID=2014617 RepID=UPI000C4DAF3D|nr:aldo/keto reductase [Halobacteriovorax sp. JY17]PIK15359.1 MAG: aldo/keto reductase [Halobacteriovorax sp. JY17]
MKFKKLGNTDIDVSLICMGTMTYGEQNTETEAFEMLDYAFDQGINFYDTAEMYPIPPKPRTVHRTEEILGNWDLFKKNRDKIIMASKVVGPGEFMKHIRGGPRLKKEHIIKALDASLERLGTDYIDLYQLHWPDRNTNYFGKKDYIHDANEEMVPLEEILEALTTLKKDGKIREIGVSNETSWGVMKYLSLSEQEGLARMQSIQNPYNLLNRTYEINLAEVSHRENIGLLAYSPLGFGMLTGKYLDGNSPEEARITKWPHYNRYSSDESLAATKMYAQIAKDFGISPTTLALSFVNSRPFLTSNIIGATNMNQLRENISSVNHQLGWEELDRINQVHRKFSNPAP